MSTSTNFLTSLLIDPQVLHGPLQPAAALIQARRFDEAHRLLLKLSRTLVREPNLWLMLAWTAPTVLAASEYYQFCLNLDPGNELAREGLASTRAPAANLRAPSAGHSPALGSSSLNPASLPASALSATVERLLSLARRLAHLSDQHFIWIMVVYLLLLALAELVTTFSNPQLGLGLHAVLMIALFFQASISRVRAQSRYLYTVALAPLIRILSLSMPLAGFQYPYWYALIGLPLLLAAFLVFRLTGYQLQDVGLSPRKPLLQLQIGFIGLPLGYLEFRILKPAALVESMRLPDLLIAAFILLIFTGFLEEFIFRGLMQRASENVMGRYGPYWISLLFAILHIGYRSYLDFTFVLFVGLIFAFIVKRTQSLWGVTFAHGLTNITLYLLMPFLIK